MRIGAESQARCERYALLLLLGVSLIVYLNSLYGDFLLDDEMLIRDNPVIRSLSTVHLATYRLVRTFSYAVDYSLWGLNPFGYHLSNIVYNGLTVLVVFLLTRRLTGLVGVSWIAALLFAVHPIHTEAVSYLAGRRDILSGLFYFLGFWSYLKGRQERKPWIYIVTVLSYLAGLLSKEMAVTLPLMIFAYEVLLWVKHHGREEANAPQLIGRGVLHNVYRFKWWILGFLILISCYLYLLLFVQGASGLVRRDRFLWWGGTPVSNFTTACRVIMAYLHKLLFPVVLQVDYHQFPYSHSLLDPRFLGSLALLASLLTISIAVAKKAWLVTFSIWWFLITLLPVMQIIPHHILMAEHYLYLPSYGFCLLLALPLSGFMERKALRASAAGVCALVVVIYGARTLDRNQDWFNVGTLMREGLKHQPDNPVYHFFLGREYGLKKLYVSAEEELAQAVGPRNDSGDVHAVRALAAFEQGKYSQGVKETQVALERWAEHPMALQNMAYYSMRMGDYRTADAYYARLDQEERSARALSDMASVKRRLGDRRGAVLCLQEVIRREPCNVAARLRLSDLYRQELKFVEGRRLLEAFFRDGRCRPRRAHPSPADTAQRQEIQGRLGDLEDLSRRYGEAVAAGRAGRNGEMNRRLGALYREVGRPGKAVEILQPLYDQGDRSPGVLRNLGWAYERLDRRPEAETVFLELYRDRSQLPADVLVEAGLYFAKNKRFQQARSLFQTAAGRGGNDREVEEYLAWTARLETMDEQASTLRAQGREVQALLLHSKIWALLGEPDKALVPLEEARESDPENGRVLRALADRYGEMGYPYLNKARRAWEALLSLRGNHAEIWKAYGKFCLTRIPDYETGLHALRRSLMLDPEQPEVPKLRKIVAELSGYVEAVKTGASVAAGEVGMPSEGLSLSIIQ